MNNIDVLKIKGEKNYVLILEDQIVYALDATKEELEKLKTDLSTVSNIIENNNSDNNNNPSLAFIVTYDCNLNCVYCYANSGGENNLLISSELIEKSINHIKLKNPFKNTLNLFLVGGGEPLLYFDKVKEICAYAKTQFNNININVVTNGTFNEEVLMWLIENDVSIRISYDSLFQDKQRPSRDGFEQSSVVRENIRKLISCGNAPMIQCIITSESIAKMIEMVEDLVTLGVKVVKFEPCLMTDISRGNIELQPNPIKFSKKLLETIEYICDKNLPILIDTGYFSKPGTGNYCGMNSGNFTITPDGMITPCVEISKKTDPYAKELMLGEINFEVEINDKNLKKIQKIGVNFQEGGCCMCNLKKICRGGCPMANIWQNGLPLRKSDFTCTIEKHFIPELLHLLIKKPKTRNVVLENQEICE